MPARAGIYYVAASAAIKLAGMAATPIFTRLMSAEEYGKYALYMSWIAILSVLSTLGLSGSVIYRGMQKFPERRDELISSALGLSLLPLTLFTVIFIIWRDAISGFIGLESGLVALLLAQIALDTAVALYTAGSRFVYGYRRVIAINVSSALMSLGAALLLVRLIEATARARCFALIGATLIFALPLILLVISKGKRLYSREIWGFLLKFNLPLLPHSVSSAILANVDKVMISALSGQAALAKYSVAHALGIGMTFITGGLGSALQPWIMRKIEAGKEERVARMSLRITALTSLGALAILAAAPELLALLAPNSYGDALLSVYPITLAAIAGFISSVASVGILHAERTALLSLSAIVGAAVNIVGNFIFLPYSFNGASISFLAASLASMAVSLISARRIMRAPIVKALPSLGIFAGSSGFALLLYSMRETLPLRVISLGIIGALAILLIFRLRKYILEAPRHGS